MLESVARWTGRTLLLGLLGLLVWAPAAFAQSAPAQPAPPGTAPGGVAGVGGIAAKPCSTPEYRQFDFWLGSWEVKNPKGEVEGTNQIDTVQNGCALQEHWDDHQGMTGTSFTFYNKGDHKWRQTWVDNQGGSLVLTGDFSGGKLVLSGEMPSRREAGKTILHRITWTPVDANHVRQFWEVSQDHGKTWGVNFDGMYNRK
jgi:hypothetical protein